MGLEHAFTPRSVAVIGASRRRSSLGNELFRNIIEYGFNGPAYPVNPHAEHICSVRAYPKVGDIPADVDLAVVIVPADEVCRVAEECGEKGVKALVVISGGFREIGPVGMERERRLRETLVRYGMRMIGPNCLGLVNTDDDVRLDATFAKQRARKGRMAFISQSGALGVAILEYAGTIGLGFSKFVSIGNKTDVSANDILELLENDPETDMILLYLENFGNPRNFTRIAKRITRKKPILAVKSGRTRAGARAAMSHTGALAEVEYATDALFQQCGVIRVNSIEELFDTAMALTFQRLPGGNRVAIVTNAGGPGIMATDACASHGVEVAEFSRETIEALTATLPEETSKQNPVDLVGDASPERYSMALAPVLKDPGVDAALVIFVPPVMVNEEEIASAIVDAARTCDKPILTCFMGARSDSPGCRILSANRIPTYMFPESGIRSLADMIRYRSHRERPEGESVRFTVDKERVESIISSLKEDGGTLSPGDAFSVLNAYGIPISEGRLVKDVESAMDAAAEIGFPVVLKAVSEDLVHKSEAKAVILDIHNNEELIRNYRDLVKRMASRGTPVDGVIVQKMYKGGKEGIIGVTYDANFGPILMFGLGGIYVEVLKDVSFALSPLTDKDAARLVRSIRSYPLLTGVRGEPPVDIQAAEEAILRVHQMVCDFPEIAELDINPFIMMEKGCVAVDARIRIDPGILQKPV